MSQRKWKKVRVSVAAVVAPLAFAGTPRLLHSVGLWCAHILGIGNATGNEDGVRRKGRFYWGMGTFWTGWTEWTGGTAEDAKIRAH